MYEYDASGEEPPAYAISVRSLRFHGPVSMGCTGAEGQGGLPVRASATHCMAMLKWCQGAVSEPSYM
ncbi:hypothetical protein D3C71_1716650 [compost metagenome]